MENKKLEDEKNNLVRVNDILSELEKQVGPLEKQSDKPKIYAFFAFLNDSNAQERKENHVLVNCSNHYYFCRSK